MDLPTNTDSAPTLKNTPIQAAPTPDKQIPAINTGSVLPSTLLSQEAKSEESQAKEILKQQVSTAKKVVVSFLLVSLAWAGWIQMNISESNSILSTFGVQMNTGQEATKLKKEALSAKKEREAIEKNIKKLTNQIEDNNYTRFSEEIREIRGQQITWFDKANSDKTIAFGLADAVPRMQTYFNSRNYVDPEAIISGEHVLLDVSNLQVSREGVSFSVDSSELLGKIFYLNIEFIEMINSFPFLKNGKLEQFARQKNETDDDAMKFSVRLERQLSDEEDAADLRFEEYLNWLNVSSN